MKKRLEAFVELCISVPEARDPQSGTMGVTVDTFTVLALVRALLPGCQFRLITWKKQLNLIMHSLIEDISWLLQLVF